MPGKDGYSLDIQLVDGMGLMSFTVMSILPLVPLLVDIRVYVAFTQTCLPLHFGTLESPPIPATMKRVRSLYTSCRNVLKTGWGTVYNWSKRIHMQSTSCDFVSNL